MNSYNLDLSTNDKYFKTTFIVTIDAKQEGGVPICCFYWLKEGEWLYVGPIVRTRKRGVRKRDRKQINE